MFKFIYLARSPYVLCRFCEDNPDSNFANCDVPQELSNEEIDKQLAEDEVIFCHRRCGVCTEGLEVFKSDLQDVPSLEPTKGHDIHTLTITSSVDLRRGIVCQQEAEPHHGDPGRRQRKRPQVWQLIRENIYTHRAPKVQDEDDVMLCHCRIPSDGGPGCGPDCLNRMLNMECVPVSDSSALRAPSQPVLDLLAHQPCCALRCDCAMAHVFA